MTIIAKQIRLVRRLLAVVLTVAISVAVPLHSARAQSLPLIRDAEIEGLMRIYSRDIFRAAGLNPGSVNVYLVNRDNINAFVAGGQRVFIHTGLLVRAKTPNEVIGVLAHEAGHIAGGHLTRLGIQIEKLSTAAIIGTLLGAAAMVGGAVAGSRNTALAGQGAMSGAQEIAKRTLLNYARAQESAADAAAVKFLNKTGQSARGMLTLFDNLARQSIGSLRRTNPYLQSHPMPFERIRNLERVAKASPHFKRPDKPALVLRHKLMRAKLIGYLHGPQRVFRQYPPGDNSIDSRYARAISAFRTGDMATSLPLLDSLIRDIPQNPYFWELKGEALMKAGRVREAIPPLLRAAKLLPRNGLVRLTLAQVLLAAGGKKNIDLALLTLRKAQRTEGDTPYLHKLMAQAYGKRGDFARANLETAEAALLNGDKKLALQAAKRAKPKLKRGTPAWQRANDILNYAGRK